MASDLLERACEIADVHPDNAELLFHHQWKPGDNPEWKSTNVQNNNGTAAITVDDQAGWHLNGDACMKIVTPAGAQYTEKATEFHVFPPRVDGKPVHYFFGVYAFMDEELGALSFYNGYCPDPTNWDAGSLTHFPETDNWTFNDGGLGAPHQEVLYTQATGANTSTPRWHRFMLGVDFERNEYVTLKSDGRDFTNRVRGIRLNRVAEATVPYFADMAIEVIYKGAVPVASTVIFDELWGLAAKRK